MQQNWLKKLMYAFPPFCLTSRVLQKVRVDQTEKNVSCNHDMAHSWYSQLLEMLVSELLI